LNEKNAIGVNGEMKGKSTKAKKKRKKQNQLLSLGGGERGKTPLDKRGGLQREKNRGRWVKRQTFCASWRRGEKEKLKKSGWVNRFKHAAKGERGKRKVNFKITAHWYTTKHSG